jgi:hypothetical protein
MLEHKGTLLRPISLDYVKALRLVLSQPHHLESLELRDWEGTIKMCFAGVFDEDLKMEGFTEGEAEGEDLFLTGSQLANQRSNGNQDRGMGGSDEEDGDPSQAIMKKRKRNLGRGLMESSQRPSSSATPSSNRVSPSATQSRSSPMKPITKRTTSQDDLALISLVHTLLQSPSSAPLLSSTLCPPHLPPKNETSPLQQASWPPSYTASSILYKLLRFLHTFPIETSAHLDVLCSLNLVFSEIALNRLDVMRTFVWRLWPVLVGVWGKTKSREIREQVLIAWRVCYPFVDEGRLAGVGRGDQELMRGAEGESAELMGRVADMLDGEVDNRWGNEALSLESLKFGMLEGEKEAFVAGSFAVRLVSLPIVRLSPVMALTVSYLQLSASSVKTSQLPKRRPGLSSNCMPTSCRASVSPSCFPYYNFRAVVLTQVLPSASSPVGIFSLLVQRIDSFHGQTTKDRESRFFPSLLHRSITYLSTSSLPPSTPPLPHRSSSDTAARSETRRPHL